MRSSTRAGPPAMLEAVRTLCAARDVVAELAMEAPMACGFGSCFGCAVPLRGGGYMRLCVDGPAVRATDRDRGRGGESRQRAAGLAGPLPALSLELQLAGLERVPCQLPAPAPMNLSLDICGIALAHPIINGSGTFDAIAARRAFGDAVEERFPFSAFVSKTITPEPRAGNPPPRLYETPAGMINSIGLPEQGPGGLPRARICPSSLRLPVPLIVSVMAPSRERVRDARRAGRGARRGRRDRAQRLLSERRIRADRRRAAGRDAGAARGAAPADRRSR